MLTADRRRARMSGDIVTVTSLKQRRQRRRNKVKTHRSSVGSSTTKRLIKASQTERDRHFISQEPPSRVVPRISPLRAELDRCVAMGGPRGIAVGRSVGQSVGRSVGRPAGGQTCIWQNG
jgi:hypothetical protein